MNKVPARTKKSKSSPKSKAPAKANAKPDAADPDILSDLTLENGLYMVSTPIGNLRDITLRALDVLGNCDLVLSEDKRVTRKLLSAYGLKPRMMAYHDHNGEKQRPKVLKELEEGHTVALVTDAGTPGISDPGYKLVRAVHDAGYKVIPIPGASAVLCALVGAGLPTDQFLFAGFMPPKKTARQAKLSSLAQTDATLVFYESARRLKAFLEDVHTVMGNRQVVIARELTKKFEEFIHDSIEDILHHLEDDQYKGEIVVLLAPCEKTAESQYSDDQLDDLLSHALEELNMSVRDAAAYVAEETGIQKRRLYARALALNHAGRSDVSF